jgi:hypothetical protein
MLANLANLRSSLASLTLSVSAAGVSIKWSTSDVSSSSNMPVILPACDGLVAEISLYSCSPRMFFCCARGKLARYAGVSPGAMAVALNCGCGNVDDAVVANALASSELFGVAPKPILPKPCNKALQCSAEESIDTEAKSGPVALALFTWNMVLDCTLIVEAAGVEAVAKKDGGRERPRD